MKPVLYLVAMGMMVLALCGCSSKFVANKNYPSANIEDLLKYDKDFCHEVARGRTPVPQLQNLPERGYSVQTQGNIQGIGLYPAYYNQTTYIDNTSSYNNIAASNLGYAIGFAIAITRRENDCMERLGWVTKSQMTPAIQQMIAENDKYAKDDIELKKIMDSCASDPMFEDVSNFIVIQIQNMTPEQRKSMHTSFRKNPESFKGFYAREKKRYEQIMYEIEHPVAQ